MALEPTGYAPDYVSRRLDFARTRRNHDYIFRRDRLTKGEILANADAARAAGDPDWRKWAELLSGKEGA